MELMGVIIVSCPPQAVDLPLIQTDGRSSALLQRYFPFPALRCQTARLSKRTCASNIPKKIEPALTMRSQDAEIGGLPPSSRPSVLPSCPYRGEEVVSLNALNAYRHLT